MATLTGGQASVVSGATSSFGQFRLTTFVDSTPKSSRTTAPSPVQRTAPSVKNVQPVAQHGENGSTLSSSHSLASFGNTLQSSPQTFAPTPPKLATTTTQSTAPAPASHNGFGILDLGSHGSYGSHGSPSVREGKLGPHRDGRVRNPVPSKLKGRTDDKNGEFSVMHMNMSGSGGHNDIPRSEAAQRTSENTAQAARAAANHDGYKGVKRRRIEASLNVQPTQDERLIQPPPSSFSTSSQHQQQVVRRTRILTSEETKYEQARLLTLLRSITPLTVVDQICKALAFFGGIPGGPPPENGSFPESADANGSGMLFVGWLSEIFPELEGEAWKPEALKPREVNRGPRPRGRPKGSKASKVRKDKGIKKGPKHPNKIDGQGVRAPAAPNSTTASGTSAEVENMDEEWVDIAQMDPQEEKDVRQRQSFSNQEGGRNRNLSKTRHQRSLPDNMSSGNVNTLVRRHDDEMDHQSFTSINQNFSPAVTSSGKRRPGRPKGSRNRQRDLELEGSPRTASLSHTHQHLPEVSTTPESQRRQVRPVTSITVMPTPSANTQQSPQILAKRRQGQVSKDTELGPLPPAQIQGLTAEEQAVIDAFRTAQAVRTTNKPPPAKKAKRSRPKAKAHTADNTSSTMSSILPPTVTTDTVPLASAKTTIQGAPTPQSIYKDSGPILPPPKRQRKAKDPNATTAKKTTQGADTSNSAPSPSAVLKSTTPSDSVAPTVASNVRAPAQGLEAHYERFANLLHQGDQQQHQQSRHELNPVTRSSPMQSASAYYQQPHHVSSPYDRQYPSRQTTNPYQPGLVPQTDSFQATNQQHANFPSQQQQGSHQFSQFPNSSFTDVPALGSATNGTRNVGAYGQGVSRSTNNANFGAGAQIGNGFESMSDINLGERLLRNIGRR